MVGRTISHFEILAKVGQGGMGVVHKARDIRLKRNVALKFISTHLLDSDDARERLLREAQAAAALEHPNICTVFEVDEVDGQTFIAMAFVEGHSLKERLRAGPLKPEEARGIALQIGLGLQAAHSRGIIHRDIKPANIMLTPSGQVKILDFGLARSAEHTRITQDGIRVGTVVYTSPEHLRGQEKVDHRTDIWSLGVVLYEMLTGKRPFRGVDDQAIIYSILNEEPRPLRALKADIPIDLQGVVRKALARSSAERFANIEEMLELLGASPSALARSAGLQSLLPHSRSVAVLPFTLLPPDPEREWFSDGMTEDIITQLARIKELKVISRTSVMQYKHTAKRPAEIARELGVATLLEGSIRESSGHLRITAQLIDARTDHHLWADTFDCRMSDVLAVQREAAMRIATALQAELSPELRERMERVPTDNLEAYALYSKGRHFWTMRSAENLRKAMAYFQRAIDKDPNYALAYAGIADVFGMLGYYDAVAPEDAFPRAREAADKALAIDKTLAEGYLSLGWVKTCFEWDWVGAEEAFQRALTLKPSSVEAHHWYGIHLLTVGRIDEANEVMLRGSQLDPLNPAAGYARGVALWAAREYDHAIAQLRDVLDVHPDYMLAHMWLARVYAHSGMAADAVATTKKAVELSGGNDTAALEFLATVYAEVGYMGDAERQLRRLLALAKRRYVSPYLITITVANLGRIDEAFEWMQRAYERRDHWLPIGLNIEVGLDVLRGDPRFAEFRKRVGFEPQ